MPLVPNNAMVREPKNFGSIPIRPGRNVYVGDVATVAHATDLNYGYALVDGRKSIYLPIIKKNTASTLQGGVRHQEGDACLQGRAAGGCGRQFRVG